MKKCGIVTHHKIRAYDEFPIFQPMADDFSTFGGIEKHAITLM